MEFQYNLSSSYVLDEVNCLVLKPGLRKPDEPDGCHSQSLCF